jgi:hypothetical protein
MTTAAGESVSGAQLPRFTRNNVKHAVESLKQRIEQVNQDSKAEFKITDAVAFGDFLLKDRSRVQAADVGIGLTLRGQLGSESRSTLAAQAERQFLSQLRGRTAPLHINPHGAAATNQSYGLVRGHAEAAKNPSVKPGHIRAALCLMPNSKTVPANIIHFSLNPTVFANQIPQNKERLREPTVFILQDVFGGLHAVFFMMAERVGFEPTVGVNLHTLSKRAP